MCVAASSTWYSRVHKAFVSSPFPTLFLPAFSKHTGKAIQLVCQVSPHGHCVWTYPITISVQIIQRNIIYANSIVVTTEWVAVQLKDVPQIFCFTHTEDSHTFHINNIMTVVIST